MSLPSGYKKLEYIQSTGTQYIQTGVPAAQNIRVTATFEITSIGSSTTFVFGAQSGNSARYCLGITSGGVFRSDYGTEYISGPSVSVGTKYTVDKNQKVCTINGTAINNSVQIFSKGAAIYLFARNYTSLSYGSLKLYACKIYSSDALTRDFIPCKNASGTVGLWDDVNSVFYQNAGTGSFTAGPEVSYKQLEYIQSNGAQYIDTGVKPDQGYTLNVKFQTNQTSGGGIAVSDTAWQSNGFGVWCNAAEFGNNTTLDVALNGDEPIEAELSQQGLYVNGALTWAPAASTFTVKQNMVLMALNRNGNISEYLTGKLYYVKLYSGTTLVRDFIPCEDSTGEVGLWDNVTSTFYQNAGTGSFTAGPEVSAGGSHLALIDGTAYNILGGRTLIGGTGYALSKGQTILDGTGYDITFRAIQIKT